MILNQENTQILIIDIQEKLLNASFNKEIIEKKSEIISKAATILNIPVIVTEQYPKGLGETIDSIKENLSADNTKYFEKVSFSALADSELLKQLKKNKKQQVIVLGIETHICVHQTVADLLKLGCNVVIASDACGSRSELEHICGLENMKSSGAEIKTTEMILFELLKTAKHNKFKEIQALIK